MMEEFSKLLRKKLDEQGGPKEGPEMEAKKMKAKELSDMLGADILEKMKSSKDGEDMSKVTVAADSPEGLKEGLEKAEDIVEDKMESEESEDESEKDEPSEDEESVDMEIADLEKKLQELKSKRA